VTTTQTRCPECSSLVRPGMAWCTLCHADLRSEEEREAARAEADLVLAHSGASADEEDSALVTDTAPQAAPVASRGRHARPGPAVVAPPAALPAATAGRTDVELDPDAAAAATAAATAAETDAKLAELQAAGIDVESMIAMLAIDRRSDPVSTFVEQRLSTKGSRAIAIIVASVTLTSLGILSMYVLGTFFG
jgi:hypothetical protein